MRKLLLGTVLIISISFTGCINIIEEIFLNKNGSGQYSITMDASGLMENGGLRSMLQMAGAAEGGEEIPEMEGPIEMDSVLYFKNAPAELKEKLKHPELLDRVSIHQQVSEEKELMKTVFTFDFEKVAEIDMFLNDLGAIGSMGGDLGPMNGMMDGLLGGKTESGLPIFSNAKKVLNRAKTVASEEMSGLSDQEGMEMVKMMLADASYKIIYHLPGLVKKTTMQNARIEGKDVIMEVPLLDSVEGKADLSGIIKYKNK